MVKSQSQNPLEKLLNQISGPWTMYVLCVLDKHGPLRFGDLRRQVEGISPKVLTDRLRMLEAIGIVHRHYNPTIPPQVSYKLTDRGKELSQPLYHLYDLATRWYGDVAIPSPIDREPDPLAPLDNPQTPSYINK